MKDWIPVIAAFLGFAAGIAGTWLTQRANRQLEQVKQDSNKQLERDKWSREQEKTKAADQKQLYIDVVEYVEDQLAWLHNLDYGFRKGQESAKLNLHPHQLAGRVKMFASYTVITEWDGFQRAVDYVHGEIRYGNMHERPDLPGTGDLDDQDAVPRAVVAGNFLILVVRADYEATSVMDQVPLLSRTIPIQDERYQAALVTHQAAFMEAAEVGQPVRERLLADGAMDLAQRPGNVSH